MTALALLLALAALAPAGAPADGVRGTVRDALSGRPLAGVRVEVDDGLLLVVTDREGRFRVRELGEGPHRLRIQHDGYELLERSLAAEPGTALDLALAPSAVRLHETVVVSANRLPTAPLDTPRAMSALSAAELARQAPRTAAEALMDVTGVWVQKTNHGGGSPFLRGMSGNQVLVMVDGVRLNNATYRYGPNQYLATVDPFSMERLEVVRGIGSVLHGSDALGGVISVFSDRPSFSAGGTEVSGRVDTRLMSAGQEKSGRFELQASGPRAAVRGGFSLRDFGDLRAGGELGVRSPSGYGETAADVKGALRVSDRHLLTAAYQHVHQSDVPRWDQVAQRGFSLYAFDPQVRQLAYAQLQSTFPSGWLDSLSATASFHRSDETRVRQTRGASVLVREQDVVDTAGLSVQVRSRAAAGWTITAGAEAYHDVVASGRTDTDEATGLSTPKRGLYADGATSLSTAAFVSGRWETGRLALDLGARFNHHRLRAEDATFGTIDVSPSALVGSVGASVAVGPGQRLFGAVSQGFRAPNIDDLSTLGLFDFGIEVPSPELRPERAWSYELGWKARTRRLAGLVSAYRMELRDLIDRVPDTFEGSPFREGQRVYRRANVGRAYVDGVEAELEWNAGRDLTAFGNVAWTYGQLLGADQPLRRIPPLNGLAGVRWAGGPLAVDARVRFAGRQDRLAPGDRADHRIDPDGTAGWAVFGARAVYTLRPDIRLVGAVENVLDEAYRVHGSGIDGYGRHVWVSAQVGF